MGLKNLKTRHITIQHNQNSGLNKLNRNYGIIYKIRQNLGYKAGWATLRNNKLLNFNL